MGSVGFELGKRDSEVLRKLRTHTSFIS